MRITLEQAIAPHPALRSNLLLVRALLDSLHGTVSNEDLQLDSEVSDGQLAILWIYAYVFACNALSERPLLTALAVYRTEILQYGQRCLRALRNGAPVPTMLLSVANRALVSVSGAKHWYDLTTARRATSRPAVFEAISYNLGYPIETEWQRLQELQNVESAL